MFRWIRRRIDDVPFVANSTQAIPIPQDFLLKRMILDLYGEVVVDVEALDGIDQFAPAELIDRIQVIASGRETIKSYTGWQLYLLNRNRGGVLPARVQPGLTVATHDFRLTLFIDFCLPNSVRPVDTLLNTRPFSSLQLKIDWGDVNSIVNAGASSTQVLQNVRLHVFVEETTAPDQDRFTIFKESVIEKVIPATNPALPIDLPIGNVINDIMINQWTDGAKTEASILNYDLVESGSIYHLQRIEWLMDKYRTRFDQMSEHDIHPQVATADVYEPYGVYIDFKEDGLISSALNVSNVRDLKLILDAVLQGTADVVYVNVGELILPPAL